MPCYKPVRGWQSTVPNANGKYPVYFSPSLTAAKAVDLPCGQCIGCRLERSRQWAVRINHEAQMYEQNCFITLTYNNENLPHDGSLNKRHFQLFMKRVRKHFRGRKIRYFQCGEYGENLSRPHYHACMFNLEFADKEYWSERNGYKYYRSPLLEKLWGKGMCIIGDLTFESAAYVARYCVKKVTGKPAKKHYQVFNTETGERFDIEPEYVTMSRRPGIGKPWLDRFKKEVYPADEVISRGHPAKPPRFYDKEIEKLEADTMAAVKEERRKFAWLHKEDSTDKRLKQREAVKQAQTGQLRRNLEEISR